MNLLQDPTEDEIISRKPYLIHFNIKLTFITIMLCAAEFSELNAILGTLSDTIHALSRVTISVLR